jgi:hypothetical protein
MTKAFLYKSLFWFAIVIALTLLFGYSGHDYLYTFYFVSLLLPVIVGTSYFFNQFLVPGFLQKKRYFKFVLYSVYTLIVSLWLEMIVLILALIFLADYKYANMVPRTTNLVQLSLALYLVVFVDGFRISWLRLQQMQEDLERIKKTNRAQYINVKVERRNRQVALDDLIYVESLADYIKIHTKEDVLITRIKISKMAEQLPNHFIRIHRSFLINSKMVESFTKEYVRIQGHDLPISRTFKAKTIEFLDQ